VLGIYITVGVVSSDLNREPSDTRATRPLYRSGTLAFSFSSYTENISQAIVLGDISSWHLSLTKLS
jgi:hypothetical protein